MEALTPEDLALLRRFEPVLIFNKGEQFYPMDVGRYLAGALLCVRRPDSSVETLIPRGKLTGEVLAQMLVRETEPDATYYLSVADSVSATEVRAFRRTSTLREFRPGPGRLVRVGISARIFDVLFSLSLLLRGRAPGGLAAGAAEHYHALQARDERYCYYGRVIHEYGYIALQYWFFYAFNDWRASFHGVNDHEADWENVIIYLAKDQQGAVQPYWLAYSAHDSDGDDLRRRWDDPGLERTGEHVHVYAGAGSHANYFFRGEYMPAVVVPYTEQLARARHALIRFWARLGQGDDPGPFREGDGFRIPFVDYARGDGLRVGPGEKRAWEMQVLQATEDAPAPPWVDGYQGLWGFYTGGPLGENAPPGPKYERNGMQRLRWYDPTGWCGLDKVPPPAQALDALREQQQRLRHEHDDLSQQCDEQADRVAGLELEATAVSDALSARARHDLLQERIQKAQAELERLKADRAANEIAQESCAIYAMRLAAGDFGDPRAHLHRPALPSSTADVRLGKIAAIWSAVSIGVLLLCFAALAQFSHNLGSGAVVLFGVYGFFEAIFHRNLRRLIERVTVALAMFTVLLLVITFFRPLLLVLVVLIGLFIIVENMRELLAQRVR